LRDSRKTGCQVDTKLEDELEPEHLKAIEALAEEIDCPEEKVNKIYASALESLKSSARIHDYLIVLTSKKVRDVLHH
jgi:hypothetical protein